VADCSNKQGYKDSALNGVVDGVSWITLLYTLFVAFVQYFVSSGSALGPDDLSRGCRGIVESAHSPRCRIAFGKICANRALWRAFRAKTRKTRRLILTNRARSSMMGLFVTDFWLAPRRGVSGDSHKRKK
jgi:hypothetical protein